MAGVWTQMLERSVANQLRYQLHNQNVPDQVIAQLIYLFIYFVDNYTVLMKNNI